MAAKKPREQRGHDVLFQGLKALVGQDREGKPVPKRAPAREPSYAGGPFNIHWMAMVLALGFFLLNGLFEKAKKVEKEMIGWLERQLHFGHGSVQGPKGVQFEQFQPWPHSTFCYGACLTALELAITYNLSQRLIDLLCQWMGFELYLAGEFQIKGVVAGVGGRAKNDEDETSTSGQGKTFVDQWRNKVLEDLRKYIMLGKWNPALNKLPGINAIKGKAGQPARELIRFYSRQEPVLYLTMWKQNLTDGGYWVFFVNNEKARAAVGRDGLTTVVFRPSMKKPIVKYDWAPLTDDERPRAADWSGSVVAYGIGGEVEAPTEREA